MALPQATADLIELLEVELTLKVSRARRRWSIDPAAKTIVLASGSSAGVLEPQMRAMGFAL